MHARSHTSGEDGFSLIELLVVMLIIGLVIGGVASSLRGAKTSGKENSARAAAQAYSTAVTQYMRDHGGRAPTTTKGWLAADIENGPRDPLAVKGDTTSTEGYYLRQHPPEAVTKKWVTVTAGAGSDPSRVEYHPSGGNPSLWELRVFRENTYTCSYGAAVVTPAASFRLCA